MRSTLRTALCLLAAGLAPIAARTEPTANPTTAGVSPAPAAVESATPPSQEATDDKASMEKEKERLALENALFEERLKKETAELRAQAERLKAEKELIAERLAHAAMLRRAEEEEGNAELQAETTKLEQQANLAKARAEALTNELKAVQAESTIEITRLKSEIQRIEALEERKGFADEEPAYLTNPLREEDNTVVISDRRIALNGPISTATADAVTDRIHYYNNQNPKLPIFIVIDESPGGSVMAGYRILKAMDSSEAPVHVVVKSFAASMAAGICTLAEESYAYPNAVILHHQISSYTFGRLNLTQQREFFEESQRWWARLGTPIAEKMGITADEFIKRMYENSTSGDWSEFGVEAQKLGWVNHIVDGIDESSFLRNPDQAQKAKKSETSGILRTGIDEDGQPYAVLPRINPKDVYFLYNPDGYYRLK
jgi:ATP-dependent Clp protease protease subunit